MLFLTLFRESIYFAFHALKVNRLRTILSLLGITIGIFAIIAVFTAVDSLENKIKSSLQSLGEDEVFIMKWPWEFNADQPWWKYLNRPEPHIAEVNEIAKRTSSASAVVFNLVVRKNIYFKSSFIENASVHAVSYDYYKVKSFNLQGGRYFTEQECGTGDAVVLIGNTVKDALFHNEDPVGKSIKIFGRKVKVIGVFAKEGDSMLGNTLDEQVIIPVQFAKSGMDLDTEDFDSFIMVKAKPGIPVDNLKDELSGVMRSIHRLKPGDDDDFALNEISMLTAQTESVFSIIGIAGWVIGAFSILVGGFGIANIMFVSVRERTSQIGIQKSLGAKSWFILTQFLAESVVLCLLGGIIGLILDYIIVLIANKAIDFGFVLTLSNVSLGITISVLIGIISGFVPAYSAAQLDPVEAIRANS